MQVFNLPDNSEKVSGRTSRVEVLRTCRLIYQEALPVLYENVIFYFSLYTEAGDKPHHEKRTGAGIAAYHAFLHSHPSLKNIQHARVTVIPTSYGKLVDMITSQILDVLADELPERARVRLAYLWPILGFPRRGI